jgi:hypothetical protein
MSDIRARLAYALHKELSPLVSYRECLNGIDILLSLPDISIVELPNSDEITKQGISYGSGAGCECCPPWVKDENSDVSFSVDESREWAATLLSAANKAEESK